jgi:predicted transcriptional regulator YdeE
MDTAIIETFHVVGLAIRTTNRNNQAVSDIEFLWERFFDENISKLIPNKIGKDIYGVYTDYDGDHTQTYTTILGVRVPSLDHVAPGLAARTIERGKYATFTARGNINEGVVGKTWNRIWNSPIPRKYTTDFEVYSEKSCVVQDAEVDIFVAV